MNRSQLAAVAALLSLAAACSHRSAAPAGPAAPAAPASAEAAPTAPAEVEPKPLHAPDVPYVPTSPATVDVMLQLAAPRPGEVVYDLGCGDGRIVIAAAQRYGTRGVGIDIDPARIAEARRNAAAAGVADRVEFRQQDLFEADFHEANVVTLYLLPDVNLRLRPKLLAQLAPGTRVVSHAFNMGDWEPQRTERVEHTTVFLWTIPDHR
jgi:SAM-dependent methyltransferase